LRELYGALRGFPLDPGIPITINTLEGILFMERINDISFVVGNQIVVLLEHQSSINPNMALRLLMYIARVYEKIIGDKTIYSTRRISIPRPEFYVLYNGLEGYADETVLKLSDAFEDAGVFGVTEESGIALEVRVKVYNINQGHNEGLLKRSRTLGEYSAFIATVRELERELGDKAAAMKKAVKLCIEQNILKGFLKSNASEVINMLVTEWNWDDALAVRWEEGRAKGQVEGRAKGRAEGRAKGWEELSQLLKEGKTLDEAMALLQVSNME
jgi:hypothetical protein